MPNGLELTGAKKPTLVRSKTPLAFASGAVS
jgi:hypothetical protein